jgi:hypothetical protein
LRTTLKETEDAALVLISQGKCTFRAAKYLKAWCWARVTHPALIEAAELFIDSVQMCWSCGGRLVPIGDGRHNGAAHRDWASRRLHKQCWIAIKKEC